MNNPTPPKHENDNQIHAHSELPRHPKGLQKELMDVLAYLNYPTLSFPDPYDDKLKAVFRALRDYDNEVARQQKVIDELEEEIKKPQSWSGEILSKQVVKQMYDRDIRLLGIISKLKGAQDD